MTLEKMPRGPVASVRGFVSEQLGMQILTMAPAVGGPGVIRSYIGSVSTLRTVLAIVAVGALPFFMIGLYVPRYQVVVCPDRIVLLGLRGGLGVLLRAVGAAGAIQRGDSAGFAKLWNGAVHYLPFASITDISLSDSFFLGTRMDIQMQNAHWRMGVVSAGRGWKWKDFILELEGALANVRPDLAQRVGSSWQLAEEHFHRGVEAHEADRLEEAIVEFNSALRLSVGKSMRWHAHAYAYRASAFATLGNSNLAIQDLETALSLSDDAGFKSQIEENLRALRG